MDSSDSLKLDENLARFLAAYDQELDGGDADAPTLSVGYPPALDPELTTERPVTPLNPDALNEGSFDEVLPDAPAPARLPMPMAPVGVGGAHRIGRFELRRQLGKGGCGIVFLAYDPRMLREVALKVPRPEMLLNPDAKRRLKLEALAASEFDHPNLVPVYEWGEVGPVCFIATAFCPGQTLAEWIDRQAFPVPLRQAVRLVATVADAVQHAHDRGVLHRDLKPNNVILQEMTVAENDEPPPGSVQLRGEYYIPRLVDFGLAKLAERGGPSETGTRQILGTPKYMAPEQAQARREDIGPPADVYALGVVLYELLAGRAPYDGATDVEVLRQCVEGKPVPPRHLRPDVPRDLEAICLKAMARTTAQRYRTAIDLADDLRRFLDGRPTVARPLAWPGRAARWFRRNDQLVAIVVLAVIALLVTLLSTWNSWQTRNLRTDHNKVLSNQAARDRADQQREYARQVRDAFLAWRAGNPRAAGESLEAARKSTTAVMEPPDFAFQYLARALDGGPAVVAVADGPITALAVSPDGARVATGHPDGTVALWKRSGGERLGSVRACEGEVRHVAFARGGALLVVAGPPAKAAVSGWSVGKDGSLAPAPNGLREPVPGAVCFAPAPDGATLFAVTADGRLVRTGFGASPLQQVDLLPGRVAALAVAPDGRTVFVAQQGVIRGYTTALAPTGVEYPLDEPLTALAVTSDGLPVVGFDGSAKVVRAKGDPLTIPTAGRVRWVATGPAGTWALSGEAGRVALAGDRALPTGDPGEVRAGVLTPDGQTLVTGGADGLIRAWNLARDPAARGVTLGHTFGAVALSADGSVRAEASGGAVVRVAAGRGPQRLPNPGGPVAAVRVLDSGAVRAVWFDGRTVVASDLTPSAVVEKFRARGPDGAAPVSAALTPDGSHLAVLDAGGGVAVWAVGSAQPVLRVTGASATAGALALSDDARHVAARTADGLSLWAVAAPDLPVILSPDDSAVFRFVPGDRLAVAGRDGAVRVWSATGREEFVLFGHAGRVTALGASPDGRTLVSGCGAGEVRFWDLRAGCELLAERRHSAPVTAIEFAGDGRLLLTGGGGQLATWDGR